MDRQVPLLLLLLAIIAVRPTTAFLGAPQEAPPIAPFSVDLKLPSGARLQLRLHPGRLVALPADSTTTVRILYRFPNASATSEAVELRANSERPEVAILDGLQKAALLPERREWTLAANWTVRGVFLGRTALVLRTANVTAGRYPVAVVRVHRWIDAAFTAVVYSLALLANLGMGTKLEMGVVRAVLRRPLAPAIGFVCQYSVMPLVAFAVGKLLGLSSTILLGYFAMGCAPGGGASNMYTYMLGGDVSLSITMTLVSTVAALGMVPLWLLTLGQHILSSQEYEVKIPFQNIILSLISIFAPIAIGYGIKRKLPRVNKFIAKVRRAFIVFLILFIFTIGIYANLFIFRLFSPLVILAGCLLPYCGFLLGGLIAFLFRLKPKFVRTVAIETGIQNTAVPIILMQFSLPQPDADFALVGPAAVSIFTPIPLIICMVVRHIYRRCCHPDDDQVKLARKEDEEEIQEKEKEEKKDSEEEEKDQEPFLERETKA